jgi:DNA-binding XRE family transcriptional regulator
MQRRPRGCVFSQQFVRAQAGFLRETTQNLRRGRMHAVHEVGNRRLAHTDALRQLRLSRSCSFQPIAKSFHMVDETIGFAYESAIGPSYSWLNQNWAMQRKPERTFLDRALEALGEKYPREKATQTRLAQLAGVKQPSVNEWGEKDRAPAIATGVDLARRLDVCVEWLYTERGPKRPAGGAQVDEHLTPILEAWPNLDVGVKRQIARYADFIRDGGE